MCDYTIKHYWDIKSKSATLEPKWLGNKIENLSKEQQTIKRIYEQTIGDATRYEQLAKNEIPEEIIGDYHIQYKYVHKVDPLGSDDKKTRQVTDIEMCIKKQIKKKPTIIFSLWWLIIVLLILVIGSWWFGSDNSFNVNENIVISESNNNTKEDIQLQNEELKNHKHNKTLKEEVCSTKLYVKTPEKSGIEKCWQHYVYDRCIDKIKDNFSKYWKDKNDPECTFDSNSKYINDVLKKANLPIKYKKFFQGENDEKK